MIVLYIVFAFLAGYPRNVTTTVKSTGIGWTNSMRAVAARMRMGNSLPSAADSSSDSKPPRPCVQASPATGSNSTSGKSPRRPYAAPLASGEPQHFWGLNKMVQTSEDISQCRDHFVHAPKQWETTLQCNVVSHWLGACTKWSLPMHYCE